MIPPRLAVLVIHGMGNQPADFYATFEAALQRRVWERTGEKGRVVVEGAHWAPVLEEMEGDLWSRMVHRKDLDWKSLRSFAVHFLADTLAYQETPHDREAYERIHGVVAGALRRLAETAGIDAPLTVVAHSLGTLIASNYFYDLQQLPHRDIRARAVVAQSGETPLEHGETLCRFYTLGSPLALSCVRYPEYGAPLCVPSPELGRLHPTLLGGWWNLYDPDDVLAWPLKGLSKRYDEAVREDVHVQVGGHLTGWTPLAHLGYWNDALVSRVVGDGVADDVRATSGPVL